MGVHLHLQIGKRHNLRHKLGDSRRRADLCNRAATSTSLLPARLPPALPGVCRAQRRAQSARALPASRTARLPGGQEQWHRANLGISLTCCSLGHPLQAPRPPGTAQACSSATTTTIYSFICLLTSAVNYQSVQPCQRRQKTNTGQPVMAQPSRFLPQASRTAGSASRGWGLGTQARRLTWLS